MMLTFISEPWKRPLSGYLLAELLCLEMAKDIFGEGITRSLCLFSTHKTTNNSTGLENQISLLLYYVFSIIMMIVQVIKRQLLGYPSNSTFSTTPFKKKRGACQARLYMFRFLPFFEIYCVRCTCSAVLHLGPSLFPCKNGPVPF